MPTKKAGRDQLLAILDQAPGQALPAIEPLKASEVVTYPGLASVLAVQAERHQGLVNLMNQQFGAIKDALGKQDEDRREIKSDLETEITRNDKRFTSLWVGAGLLILGEVLKLVLTK